MLLETSTTRPARSATRTARAGRYSGGSRLRNLQAAGIIIFAATAVLVLLLARFASPRDPADGNRVVSATSGGRL